MRRLLLTLAIGLILPAVARADGGAAVLGDNGELYRLRSGTYRALFNNPPEGAGDNPVLALEIIRDGQLQRRVVPGTEGPDLEQFPALAMDHATNRVYLLWEELLNIHSVLALVPYSPEEGFGDAFELSGDPFSTKSNPQLAATLDTFVTLDAEGHAVSGKRTILHLVWWDNGGAGERALYTPLVIENGVPRINVVFDLQELASGEPASGAASAVAPAALLQKPQIRSGRDGQSVVIAFVEPTSARLSSLELRSVTGELVAFADKARAQIIDTGRSNPSLSRPAIAAKARAQIIDTGRRLLRADVADFLTGGFLDNVAGSDPAESLEISAEKARAQIIDTGVSLRRGVADRASSKVIEIGRTADAVDDEGTSHLLDLRDAARRDLPALPANEQVRVFVSQKGDDAACAWSADNAVSYRETMPDGSWSPIRTLAIGSLLSSDDAYKLVEQRLAVK